MGSDAQWCPAMALLRLPGDTVRAERHAACPIHRPDLVAARARDMIDVPRLGWRAYGRRGGSATALLVGWRAPEKKRLAVTDRAGHRAFEAIADAGRVAISDALLPVMSRDAVLCTDGLARYARIATDARIPHFALIAGRPSKRTRRSHQINTVDAVICRVRTFMHPFCGPASTHLAACGR